MLTVARPVRAAARLVRKSSTAVSMRVLSCVYISFNAGMAAIPDIAITQSLKRRVANVRLYSEASARQKSAELPCMHLANPFFAQAAPLKPHGLWVRPGSVDADPTVSQQLRRQRQALLQREEQVEQPGLAQLKEQAH